MHSVHFDRKSGKLQKACEVDGVMRLSLETIYPWVQFCHLQNQGFYNAIFNNFPTNILWLKPFYNYNDYGFCMMAFIVYYALDLFLHLILFVLNSWSVILFPVIIMVDYIHESFPGTDNSKNWRTAYM